MPSDLESKPKTPSTASFPSDVFSSLPGRRNRRLRFSTDSNWSPFRTICLLALAFLLTSMYLYLTRDHLEQDLDLRVLRGKATAKLKTHESLPPRLKKSLVLASYISQNVSWLDSMPSDWDIARMMLDDSNPNHKYTVPRNQGREAMAYLTFIIDNYNRFPDVAVFIHGHLRSWHQPETITSKVRALNITSVQEEGYISLRCKDSESCGEGEGLRYKSPPYDFLGLLPIMWSILFPVGDTVSGIYQIPELIRYKCCAQFAVSRQAVHARPLSEWRNIRQPLIRGADDYEGLQDLKTMGGGVDWNFGMLYEALWPIFFGKSADHCPSEEYCQKVHFQDAVTCDFYAHNLWEYLDDPHMNCTDVFDGAQPYFREEKELDEEESDQGSAEIDSDTAKEHGNDDGERGKGKEDQREDDRQGRENEERIGKVKEDTNRVYEETDMSRLLSDEKGRIEER